MPKKTPGLQRPFKPQALADHASAALFPRIGSGAPVHRYTVVVPIEQIRPLNKGKATNEDLEQLELALLRDFGGITTLPPSAGYGLRNPEKPASRPEMNFNAYFVVYASPVREADRYFRALQMELQDALQEGVILIEKQQVFLV